MRRLLAFLLSLCLISPAFGQVQGGLSGSNQYQSLGIGTTPPVGGLTLAGNSNQSTVGITANYTGSGAYGGAGPYIFAISESFTTAGGTGFVAPFVVQDTMSGAGTGQRQAFTANLFSSVGTVSNNYVAAFAAAVATAGSGHFFGNATNTQIQSGAATSAEAVGAEYDIQVLNASVVRKVGVQVADICTSAGVNCSSGAGTSIDSAYLVGSDNGAVGFANGVQIGQTGAGLFGVKSTGNLFNTAAITVANGIHLNNATITGNAYDSTGFTVDGSGNATVNALNGANNISGVYPSVANTSWTITDNFTSGGGEVDFWNRQTAGSPKGFNFYQMTGAGAATLMATLTTTAGLGLAGNLAFGGAVLTLGTGEMGWAKTTASGSAPGAAGTKMAWVCGTNAGTSKLISYAGTSTTPVTVIDNVGAGVTGC